MSTLERSAGASRKLCGKPPYMAPEHILGQTCDRRADLFAAGALLYELLSGVHPFLADDDQITMTRIASARPAVPLSSRVGARRRGVSCGLRVAPFPDEIPSALDRLVSTSLAKSPSLRMATAAEFMRALDEAVPGAALTSTDALVARWTTELVGGAFQLRTQLLRDALESLDRGAGGVDNAQPPLLSWSKIAGAMGAAILGCALAGFAAVGDGPVPLVVLFASPPSPDSQPLPAQGLPSDLLDDAAIEATSTGLEHPSAVPEPPPIAASTTTPRLPADFARSSAPQVMDPRPGAPEMATMSSAPHAEFTPRGL
jgi:serine/threonine protein kinase